MYVGLFALMLACVSSGTAEFVITGILPEIASDLGVPVPTAGLLVTGYAAGVAVAAPLLSLAANRFPRKQALLGLIGIFIVAQLACASAPNYETLMIARFASAAAHGCMHGLAVVLATQMAPADRRGSALSIVLAAVPVANIVGVPIGTALGTAFGWRAAFWMVLAMASISTVAIAIFVGNAVGNEARATLARQFRALANVQVLSAYAMIILFMVGFWSLNTFVASYLTDVGSVPLAWVPIVLMVTGICGTIGTMLGGRLADRGAGSTLVFGLPAIAAGFGLLYLAGQGNALNTAAAFGLLWLVGTIVLTPLQLRVVEGASDAPELASTLISSIFNVGVALGASLGASSLAGGVELSDLPAYGIAGTLAAGAVAAAALWWERTPHRQSRSAAA
jgi:MFS transporter, DHA1 family, inner membrane transport protein